MFFHRALIVTVLSGLSPLTANGASILFINEFHYDNAGGDTGEGVEVAGAAGTLVDGWALQFYNGGTGADYRTVVLSGTIADQANGYGVLFFETGALQNGAPDGFALVDAAGNVQQFLSYEGSFVATSGFAAGLTSTDIGVQEPGDTPTGWSLQLAGTGTRYDDFGWSPPDQSSYGQINPGQNFAIVPLPGALPMMMLALLSLVRCRALPGKNWLVSAGPDRL